FFALVLAISLAGCYRQFAMQSTSAQEVSPASSFAELWHLAETKTAAKQWDEAAALWEQVVRQNPVDVKFWRFLAQTRYQAKNYRNAIPAFEKVIELRGGFPSGAAYNIACCYALLGEKEPALRWLEKSFGMGFRDLARAQTDTDLQSLHDDPRFQKIVALIDTSRMSREEGWRYDLALLAREVKRKGYAPFRKISETEFDASIRKLNDSISNLTDMQIIIEMMKLMAKLGDGHTTVSPGPNTRPEFLKTLPLKFYLFEEGLYVIAVDPKYKQLLGAQVLRFGNHTVDEVVAALDPLINRDASDIWVKERAPFMMRSLPLLNGLGLIPDPAKVQLTIRDTDGRTSEVKIASDLSQPNIWNVRPNPNAWINVPQSTAGPLPLYLKNISANYWFEYLPDSREVYFQYNTILDDPQEPLAKFSDRLFQFINEHEVEKLVIDMRWNNGGNTFLNQPIFKGLINSGKLSQRGKLFVIIGRRVFSAAQNATALLERYTNAIFVGEQTGSSPNFTGEELFFTLPYSKLAANVSDLYWQSSWPNDYRTSIAPQIYIPPTFAAYRANRDPVMEAIQAYR
ncbi:MAG TPA: tetratricopeptide repeat protein, partial [Acidobacteriota bacterium]